MVEGTEEAAGERRESDSVWAFVRLAVHVSSSGQLNASYVDQDGWTSLC